MYVKMFTLKLTDTDSIMSTNNLQFIWKVKLLAKTIKNVSNVIKNQNHVHTT
jgi:hypothetical protein